MLFFVRLVCVVVILSQEKEECTNKICIMCDLGKQGILVLAGSNSQLKQGYHVCQIWMSTDIWSETHLFDFIDHLLSRLESSF